MTPGTTPPPVEPLTRALDASDRFHRDSSLGRIYHPGTVSYRERRSTDSLHIVIDRDQIWLHVDRISPLRCGPDGSVRYSLTRIVAHNLVGVHAGLTHWLLRRHPERQRRLVDPDVVTSLLPARR